MEWLLPPRFWALSDSFWKCRTQRQTMSLVRWFLDLKLQWPHDERDGVSNQQRLDCLLNRLFWRRAKKTSKLRVIDLCEGNLPTTGEFPGQKASNAENVSIWWRHHEGKVRGIMSCLLFKLKSPMIEAYGISLTSDCVKQIATATQEASYLKPAITCVIKRKPPAYSILPRLTPPPPPPKQQHF